MPGIVGIINNPDHAERNELVRQMTDSMMHESFYRCGTSASERLGVTLGWVAHEKSFADCMPAWNGRRDICVIFSGEEYTEPSVLDELRTKGHRFDPDTASYLPCLYEELGADAFLRQLNGTFGGVVLDLRSGKVVLFNDRYGLHRVYISEHNGAWYFASEAKALLKVLPDTRQLDSASLGEYFVCGAPLQDRTLFSGVSLLPPASGWTFSADGHPKREHYFSRTEWEALPQLSIDDYYEKLRGVFPRVVRKYFRGKQPISLAVTGGIDSRMVIAGAPCPAGSLPTYSNTGMYQECVDATLGRAVAAACGHPHSLVTVDQEFFAQFPDLVRRTIYYTDGALDAIGAAGLYANIKARALAPVRMTGNYGGEILRGLVVLRPGSVAGWIFTSDFSAHLRKAGETFAEERKVPRASFVAFKQVPWHHAARFAMESSQATVRSPFLDNELVPLAYQIPDGTATNQMLNLRLVADCCPALDGMPTDRGSARRPVVIPVPIWQWWRELLPRIEYVYDYGMPNWFAPVDRLLGPLHLDRRFLGIQKYYHYRPWYRHELASFVKETILDSSTLSLPFLNRTAVEQNVMAHVSGRGNHTLEIHKLLALAFIQRDLLQQHR
jgi:asparagine synthase (glutamine-hydrolysing)